MPTWEDIARNPKLRIKLAKGSLAFFAYAYLAHYIKADIPEFHWEMYKNLQEEKGFYEVISFRGSGKSTIASLALPLWSALFGKRRFIILISDTHPQAKQIITNLIYELEHNETLIRDFGNMKGHKEDWTATNIMLANDTRITAKSRGQKVRGLRHLQFRPDLIVADDIENIDDVASKDQRDKTEDWFFSDVVPTLDVHRGKMVVVGNLLHQDSALNRIKKRIVEKNLGTFSEYPLINAEGHCLWSEEYPPERIEKIKGTGLKYFQREYMLQIMATEDQIVKRVGYYKTLPVVHRIAIGVDLAISEKESSDYTSIAVVGEAPDSKMYVMKNDYGRWDFNRTMEKVFAVHNDLQTRYPNATITLGIEDVAYQKSAIQEFYRRYKIQPIAIKQTRDKRARLETLAPYIENDNLLFPETGTEDMLNQLFNFGTERYDDCIDSLEIATRQIINAERQEILWI